MEGKSDEGKVVYIVFSYDKYICSVSEGSCDLLVGVDDAGGPPVTIPNTEVKPSGAEDTWLEMTWENREMPTLLFLRDEICS